MKTKTCVIQLVCALSVLFFALTPAVFGVEITPDISDPFYSPGTDPVGLAYDGTYLWNADADDHIIYKLDTSGEIIDSFYSPGFAPSGLAFDGTYLWNADVDNQIIYKLDTSGEVIDFFDSPGTKPAGLAFDGTYLWHADADEQMIYKLDTSGNITNFFYSPGPRPAGLAYDGTYLWNADPDEERIFKLDTSGEIIDSFYSPGFAPAGLAFDGTYLWNTDIEDDEIYRIDVSPDTGEPDTGYLVTPELWIRAVIRTAEKGPIEAVWKKGGQGNTAGGHSVIWGYFYASPDDVAWGSEQNPDLFVKIWFDASGRVDVNFFHVSVPEIEVYSAYPYNGATYEYGITTMDTRYIRQYYMNGQSDMEKNYENGDSPAGYSPGGNPSGYPTLNNLRIGALISTVEKGLTDAMWHKGGEDSTAGGHQVLWGHFYASPSDVNWGDENNPDLFVKVWFDASGRVDVNYFHVSVPDIEVYSDLPDAGYYDKKGTTIMRNRYVRHEFWRDQPSDEIASAMVERHNHWRRQVGVPDIVWSSELAAHAQEWADYLNDQDCLSAGHRPDDPYGENIAIMWGENRPQDVVDYWAGEKTDYDHASNSCADVCGHYTQIVWGSTTKVGCGKARCGNDIWEIWVCNYDPPGNWVGERPY